MRVVLDTNVIVSAVCYPRGPIGELFRRALETLVLLSSDAQIAELTGVLSRRKLDRYAPLQDRLLVVLLMQSRVEFVTHSGRTNLCSDPKDDHMLDLCSAGSAEWLVTGDQILLDMHSFEGTQIVSPRDFAAMHDVK